ncbi:MAG: flippase [bacterium]|nr:flippase [bacterium]
MSIARTIAKNTIFLWSADIISKVMSFFLVIVIANKLEDTGLGMYSFIFAFTGLFLIFYDFGVSLFMVREVARDKKETEHFFQNILSLKLIFAFIVCVLPIIAISFMNEDPAVTTAVYIISVMNFFLTISGFFGMIFQAYEKMEYLSLMNIMERVITVCGGILVLSMGYGLIALAGVFLFSYIVNFFLYFFFVRKIVPIGLRFDIDFLKRVMKNGLPFWFTTIFVTIYFRIDTVMLTLMSGYEVTGWYNASYRALDALYFIPGSVVMAIYPAMSKLYTTNRDMLEKLYRKTFYFLFVIALPIAVGTTLLAERILLFIYPEQHFKSSVLVLQIIIWAAVIIFVSTLTGYLLNSINKQKYFTYAAGFCAVLNVVLNFILIPKMMHIGATIATIITEFCVFMLLFYFIRKFGYKINIPKIVFRPVIAGIVMGLVIHFLIKDLHLLLIIPIAAATYALILFIVGGLGKEEKELIRTLLKSKQP